MDNLDHLPSIHVENGLARLVWGAIARYKVPWAMATKCGMTTRIHFVHTRNGKVIDQGYIDGPEYPLKPYFERIKALGYKMGIPKIAVRVKMNGAEHEVANY